VERLLGPLQRLSGPLPICVLRFLGVITMDRAIKER
jgi:hypothetical protein